MGRRYMAIPAVVNTPIRSLCSECIYIYLGIGACDVYDQTRRRVSDQAGFKQSLYETQPLNFVSHHSSGRVGHFLAHLTPNVKHGESGEGSEARMKVVGGEVL